MRLFVFAAFVATAVAASAADLLRVQRVVDGDTVVVESIGKVRLIGVNTPETKDPRRPVQYFGKEASAFLEKTVGGKRVRIEYDQEKKDKFGRTLAYLHLEDGTFVNAKIIREGYGFAYTRFPFKHLEEFRAFEREARENGRGLWAETKEKAAPKPKSEAKAAPAGANACAPRKTCRQMKDCDEAKYHLAVCGNRQLDGDRDGVPCEKLCLGK